MPHHLRIHLLRLHDVCNKTSRNSATAFVGDRYSVSNNRTTDVWWKEFLKESVTKLVHNSDHCADYA